MGSVLLQMPSYCIPFEAEFHLNFKNAIKKQAKVSVSKVMAS